MHTHKDPLPSPIYKAGPEDGPLFKISLAQKNGCDSTKPRLNRRWDDCLVTVTNDLMWKRQDQMCAEQRLNGAPTCQTMGPWAGRQVAPRSLGQNVLMDARRRTGFAWSRPFLGVRPGARPCPCSNAYMCASVTRRVIYAAETRHSLMPNTWEECLPHEIQCSALDSG